MHPEAVAHLYSWLRSMPPFNGWKLPPADQVEFRVNHRSDEYGRVETTRSRKGFHHVVGLSRVLIGREPVAWMRTLAHEMIHMANDRRGIREHHGADFRRRAEQVCRAFFWDSEAL